MSDIPDDVMREAKILANGIIPSMCMTYDHSFGLMSQQERDGLLLTFSQISDHEVRPAIIKAILSERERCAKIADGEIYEATQDEEIGDESWMWRQTSNGTAERIAAVIRGTSTP